MFVPVVDKDNVPLMPTTPSRARRWVRSGKATSFWKKGVYCVRLNVDPSDRILQEITVGIDPGSKREAFTVKSEAHTYLNVLSHAVTHVQQAMHTRRALRRHRRSKAPCRKNKTNRSRARVPASTRARWDIKLRICEWLKKLYPIVSFVVEDIKAKSWRGATRWNRIFSPLQVGKTRFYEELSKLGTVYKKSGFDTKTLRDQYGLKKSRAKLAEKFSAHCVDSWVLANWLVGGHTKPDNERMIRVIPLRFHRRQLHGICPTKGGYRRPYGGTLSHGLKRGGLVAHKRFGLTYVGGYRKNRITLHSVDTGERVNRSVAPEDVRFLAYNSWRIKLLPAA